MSVDLNVLRRRIREDAGESLSNYWVTKLLDLIAEVEQLRRESPKSGTSVSPRKSN